MMFLLLACAPADSLRGTLVDARTGAPVPGVTVRGEAEGEGCLRVSTETDAAGAFRIDTPCAGTYTLSPVDPTWWLPEPVTTRGGEVKLEAWRAPESGGIWRLGADGLAPLPTNTALGHQTTRAGVSFRYPLILPGDAPTFRPGDTLVLAGSGLSGWSVAPLVPSPPVETPIEAGAASFAPWVAIGITLAADGTGTPATVALDEAVSPGGVAGGDPPPQAQNRPDRVRYLPAGTLPAGRYALADAESARALVFNVGE